MILPLSTGTVCYEYGCDVLPHGRRCLPSVCYPRPDPTFVETVVSPVLPLSAYSFALDKPTTGTGTLSDVSVIESVNGHSLDGYLATAFARLFGVNVQGGNAANETNFRSAA